MANKLFGEARLQLADGQELTLRFDFNALCEAEEAADASTEEMMKAMAAGSPRLKLARALLYGALRYHHRQLSLEEAGELFMTDSEAVSEALGKAIEEMAARKEAANPTKGAGRKPIPSRGIGTSYSKSGAKAA